MNRWLTRKKDGEDAIGKKSKKGKKSQEDAKPEFNLNAALPQVDDFRTSLIMPGLSTRFSMLREQDNPNSKIGKASDDSVLQPKRQSRLHEFGFIPGGLSDIDEVSSLHGSIRPPFANERSNSFDSSRDDDGSGSIMSRARPGEGNVLFGGRQKIYMISNNSTKGTGRTLYDDDVNMSAFQRLRLEEKEKLRLQTEETTSQHSEPSSPSARSRKRETSSSTTSGTPDARTSTAATSITSQGANSTTATSPAVSSFANRPTSPDQGRSANKTRRLYDQGLDQHFQEQQSSAMSRLNTIQKTRSPTGRSTPPILLPQARSATNLNDRFNKSPAFRSDSPNQSAYHGISRNNSSAGCSPVHARPLSPPLVSPVLSESEEAQALDAALEPNDRGKATAMGAFNKPKEAFSEEQYAERLRHMQQELGGRKGSVPKEDKSSPPRKPTLRERAEIEKRRRAEAEPSQQQNSAPPTEPNPAFSAFSRFQAAASQMKIAGSAAPRSPPKQADSPPQNVVTSKLQRERTLFTSPDSSDADEDMPKATTRRFENLPVATGPAPSLLEHPALRSHSASNDKITPTGLDTMSYRVPQSLSPRPDESEVDSPTLGPDNGGLSGLIRQHLRNVSNVSSNYDGPDQSLMSTPAGLMIQTQDFEMQRRLPGSETVTPAPSTYSHSNPWDLDDMDNRSRDDRGSLSSVSPIDHSKITPLIMSATSPNSAAPWDLTPRRHHERIASNETDAEHEAFQRDLAQRQRLIQENLRARAEGRSTSPAPPGPSGGLKTALNMLRAKSSRESFATVDRQQDGGPKSMRKLTLGSASTNVSSTSLVGLHGVDTQALKSKSPRVLQQSEQDAQRELQSRQRSGTDSSRTGRTTGRSGPATTRSSTRERSGSGTSSNRSRSRPDMYRDDLEQAMVEGSRVAYPANTLPSMPGYVAHPTPPLPPSEESQSRIRSRSNSRTAATNYFDPKHLQPTQTGTQSGNISPRLPLPQAKVPTGAPISPRPSPGGFSTNGFAQPTSPIAPFSANHTPPASNPTTPNAANFPGAAGPLIRQGILRKKSIAKVDISEPVFISTTSSIDLVDLPPGASIRNGVEEVAPPVPPINPMRRRFGFGRGENPSPPHDSIVYANLDSPRTPFAEPPRSNSSDAAVGKPQQPRNRLRKTSSEGKTLRGTGQIQTGPSPPVPQAGIGGRNDSPPRAMNHRAMVQQPMDGAMF